MAKKKTAKDIVDDQRRVVVEKIIEDMKRDGLHWAEPWLPALAPHNPVSGTVYHGSNRLHLAFTGYYRGCTDSRWLTLYQISDAGWKLKKGSKSAIVENWKLFNSYKDNEETGEREVAGKFPHLVGYWRVFNAEDVEGIPPEPQPVHESDRTGEIATNLIASSRCKVFQSPLFAGSASYAPRIDTIHIAPRSTFRSDESFTRTLLHEMTHSTGHPSALARELDTKFGSASYAQEELVAELGALFTSAELGIQTADMEGDFYENHVTYLQSWLSALEDNPDYLFNAASKADKACGYIMERYEKQLEQAKEAEVPSLEQEIDLDSESRDMDNARDALVSEPSETEPVTLEECIA